MASSTFWIFSGERVVTRCFDPPNLAALHLPLFFWQPLCKQLNRSISPVWFFRFPSVAIHVSTVQLFSLEAFQALFAGLPNKSSATLSDYTRRSVDAFQQLVLNRDLYDFLCLALSQDAYPNLLCNVYHNAFPNSRRRDSFKVQHDDRKGIMNHRILSIVGALLCVSFIEAAHAVNPYSRALAGLKRLTLIWSPCMRAWAAS